MSTVNPASKAPSKRSRTTLPEINVPHNQVSPPPDPSGLPAAGDGSSAQHGGAEPTSTPSRQRQAGARVAKGVAEGVIVIIMLLYLPRYLEPYLASQGLNASTIISSLSAGSAIYIVATLAVTVAVGAAVAGTRYVGVVTAVEGVIAAAYFYRLLGHGTLAYTVLYHGYPLTAAIGVEYMFILFELSAAATVVQGLLQLSKH